MARKRTPLFEDFLPVSPTRGTTTPKAAPTPVVAPAPIAEDPYYKRDPRTGLSPAQVDAQNAAKEAATEARKLGIPAVFTPGAAGTAGRVTVTPTTASTTKVSTPVSTGGGFDMNAFLAQQSANERLAAEQRRLQAEEEKRRAGQSAYSLLLEQFNQFGMGALVQPLQDLITQGLSAAEMTLRLRDTDAYKKRFAANQQRINRGLRALSEAEYIGLEDQYQNIMRNYGLPDTYYKRGDLGRQEGFEKFIAGDVSAAELEDRIQTAQNRVINAAPEVGQALRNFYPGITNGDILAYALNPDQALTEIRRKVTAAEIGGAAMAEGLATGLSRAEELARFGVTGAGYREAAPVIKQAAERGSQLAGFYDQGVFDQATAEQAVLGISGSADAQKKIKKLTQLEQASFSGQAGAAGGALARDRAGAF